MSNDVEDAGPDAAPYYRLSPDQWVAPAPASAAPPTRLTPRVVNACFAAVALSAAVGVGTLGRPMVDELRRDREQAAAPPGTATAIPPPLTDPALTTTTTLPVGRPENAVYQITVDGCGRIGSGSGFALDAHHVVTNAHVVDHDAHPQLRSPTGERFVGRVIGVSMMTDGIRMDPEATPDVAVIEVDLPLPSRLQWAPAKPHVGERLQGMTFPDGAYTPSSGTVTEDHRQGYFVRGDFDSGSSGGPVMNAAGDVVGLVTGKRHDGHVYVFSAAALQPLVDGMLAEPKPLPNDCG